MKFPMEKSDSELLFLDIMIKKKEKNFYELLLKINKLTRKTCMIVEKDSLKERKNLKHVSLSSTSQKES